MQLRSLSSATCEEKKTPTQSKLKDTKRRERVVQPGRVWVEEFHLLRRGLSGKLPYPVGQTRILTGERAKKRFPPTLKFLSKMWNPAGSFSLMGTNGNADY